MSVHGPTVSTTAPAVASPPVPATPACPETVAGGRNDEVSGVVGGGVVENVGTLLGPGPADDDEINGEMAKSGWKAPSVS